MAKKAQQLSEKDLYGVVKSLDHQLRAEKEKLIQLMMQKYGITYSDAKLEIDHKLAIARIPKIK